MREITVDEIAFKLHKLTPEAKSEVFDFIEFLISKKRTKSEDKKKVLEVMLSVSQWSDEDIQAIEDAGKELNKWRIETF